MNLPTYPKDENVQNPAFILLLFFGEYREIVGNKDANEELIQNQP
jgi:hypothetical protein